MPVLHLLMFVRCVTCYPLNIAGARNQIFSSLYGNRFPSYAHVFVYNFVMVGLALLFAIFYDKVSAS